MYANHTYNTDMIADVYRHFGISIFFNWEECKLNYYNQKCPHCNKVFTKEDDIVVCPICGTPQHRECYEIEERCVNYEKHSSDYEWNPNETTAEDEDNECETIVCGNCGTENSKDSFFCKHCSTPLSYDATNPQGSYNSFNNNSNNNNTDNQSFNGMPFVTNFIDNESEIASGVTIKEANKYVKNNTTLYSFVFKRIHDMNRSRFNFAAFLFSGGWFLYRKQYLLGTILTILFGICLGGYAVTAPHCYKALADFANTIGATNEYVLYNEILKLPFDEAMTMLASGFFQLARYIIMIISGFIANRCYYKHVVKKVKKAKENYKTNLEIDAHLESTGGVDKLLGNVLLIAYFILSILPNFLTASSII